MRSTMIGAAALAAATLAGPAVAAPYTFSYGITDGTSTITYASGVINTGASCGNGCFYVDSITNGTNRGQAITFVDFFADFGDQMFYPNAAAKVSGSGLTYQVADGSSYNIYATGGGYNEFHYNTATDAQIGQSAFASFFTVTPGGGGTGGGVPEPATWAMLVMGFGLVGAALRRRRFGAAALA